MSDPRPPAPLRITAEDLDQVPLPAPPPAPAPRVSQLAVASLVLGLLGIPLVGLLLGPIAIACGVLAIGAIQRRDRLTGLRLAVGGMVLGTLDLVGWTAALFLLLSRPALPPSPEPGLREAAGRVVAGITEAPPHIRRALEANVLVRCRGDGRAAGLGSGVVVGRGPGAYYVLTNRHVAECGAGAARLTAASVGGGDQPAVVAWSAPDAVDAVVLRVALDQGLPAPAALRASKAPRVGDAVFAIGNPLGYEATFTAGVLSAMRAATYGRRELRVYQVQASVNPGHSGGGLYDAGGHLIGLNTWIAGQTGAQGLGFAVATDDLLRLVREGAPPELTAALGGGQTAGGAGP